MCTGRAGSNGTLNCAYDASPTGKVVIVTPPFSGAKVIRNKIMINDVSEDDTGAYDCIATNILIGISMSVARTIEFFVGGNYYWELKLLLQ